MSSPAPAAVQDQEPRSAAGPTSAAGTQDQETTTPTPAADDQAVRTLKEALDAVAVSGVKIGRKYKHQVGAALARLAQAAERTAQLRYQRELDAAVDEELAREDAAGTPVGGRLTQAWRWLVRERLLVGAVAIAGACGVIAVLGQVDFYLSLPKLPVLVAFMFPIGVELVSWWNGAVAAKCVEDEQPSAKYTRRMWGFAGIVAAVNGYHGVINVGEWSVGLMMGSASLIGPAVWHGYTAYKRGRQSGRTYEQLRVAAKQRLLSPVMSWRADRIEVLIGARRDVAWRLALSMRVSDVRRLLRAYVRGQMELVSPTLVAALSWGADRAMADARVPARRESDRSGGAGDAGQRRGWWGRRRAGKAADENSAAAPTDVERTDVGAESGDGDRDSQRDRDRDGALAGIPNSLPWPPRANGIFEDGLSSHAQGGDAVGGGHGAETERGGASLEQVLKPIEMGGMDLERLWAAIGSDDVTLARDQDRSRVTVTGSARGPESRRLSHGDRDRRAWRERDRDGHGRRDGASSRDRDGANGRERDSARRARRVTPGRTVNVNGRDVRDRDSAAGQKRRIIDEIRERQNDGQDLNDMKPMEIAREIFGEGEAERKRPHVSKILRELREAAQKAE